MEDVACILEEKVYPVSYTHLMTERLSGENAWAIYIDNDTLEVKWHTENLSDTVPLHYTISDIASLTRGYIDCLLYTSRCV